MLDHLKEAQSKLAFCFERDLLARVGNADVEELIMVEVTASLAAQVHISTSKIREKGCNERWAMLHSRGTDQLLRGLHLLGTHRIANTLTERTLAEAIQVQDGLAELFGFPPHE